MRKWKLACVLAGLLLLAGCASTGGGTHLKKSPCACRGILIYAG